MPSSTALPSTKKRRTRFRPRRVFPQRAEAMDWATIAGISSLDVARMSSDELVRVVSAAELPHVPPGVQARLDYRDRPTLERLAHQARLCSRHHEEANHG